MRRRQTGEEPDPADVEPARAFGRNPALLSRLAELKLRQISLAWISRPRQQRPPPPTPLLQAGAAVKARPSLT